MFSVFKKFSVLLEKRQKRRAVILMVLMVMGSFLEVMGVSLMIPLISTIMNPKIIEANEIVSWVCHIMHLRSHRTFMIACIIALIFIFFIKTLYLTCEYYLQARFVYNNQYAMQKRLLSAFMQRPYEYYLNVQSGSLINIFKRDVVEVYALLMILLGFATDAIISITLILAVFFIDPAMTLFIGAVMGITMFFIARVVKPILRNQGINSQTSNASAYQWLVQTFHGIKEIKVTHKENFFEVNYEEKEKKFARALKWNAAIGNVPRLMIEAISVCAMLGYVAVLTYCGRDLETLLPSMGAMAMAAARLLPSANRVVAASNAIAYQEPSLNKLLETLDFLSNQPDKEKRTQRKEEVSAPDLKLDSEIKLNGITYSYPNSETKVLQQADMCVPIGKSVGIVGTSGAGKTTVVDIMLGLLKPQEGQVLADGVDVMSNYASWLSHIGYIPQTIFMLDGTIRENVAFGLAREKIDDAQVWHVLEEAKLAEYVRSLPEGLDTEIGERGVRLSGGQRQRIGIARALYPNPELLFFDEATSALDNETEMAIMESINNLHGKKTLIIIAHRLQTIEGCDIVYHVADGKIERER